MKQYFEVGEEVILCSEDSPESNGEHVVFMAVPGKSDYIDPISGHMESMEDGFGYLLEGLTDMDIGEETYSLWEQSTLRKKHQPGEDHSTFMDKITSGDKIEEPA